MQPDPTPHHDVNELLSILLVRTQATLGDRLVGLYLFGSIATADFDRESSDIDFLAATAGELDDREVERLRLMHEEIAANGGPWGARVEGAYVSLSALRRYDPAYRQPFLSGQDTPFGVTELGADWVINRHILREKGVVLYGPSPATLIDPVSHEQLIDAVRDELRGSWSWFLEAPQRLRPRRYQAFAVLTLCRALYALDRGQLASKAQAALWAKGALGPEWVTLIDRALASRHDETVDNTSLQETLRFLRYAVGRASRYDRAGDCRA